jgi:hypothetical protein
MKRLAFITGATSGIGYSTAELLARNGFDLILNGRREDRLKELKEKLQKETDAEILLLPFDVRHYEEVKKATESLEGRWRHIDVLVNNAGLALGLSDLQEGNIEDWDTMIDTNVKGLLYVTRLIAPLMIERNEGHIINISSIAGKEVYPKGNVYCATKHAVDALSKAMRIDMLKYNIKVTSINPGLLETEFSVVRFHGDETRAKSVYQGLEPLHPEDIAEAILFALTRPHHVNIPELHLTPLAQATAREVVRG